MKSYVLLCYNYSGASVRTEELADVRVAANKQVAEQLKKSLVSTYYFDWVEVKEVDVETKCDF